MINSGNPPERTEYRQGMMVAFVGNCKCGGVDGLGPGGNFEVPRVLGQLVLTIGIVVLLNACLHEGDDGEDGTTVYTVSTVAGMNGSISPISVDVAENDTTAFTITPDSGYEIDTASGCGGSLAGNVYTTDVITGDCTVSVMFVARVTMAITDIYVQDAQYAFPSPEEGYKAIVRCTPGSPDCVYRPEGWDVNEGIGGDTVVILMKQEEVSEDSDAIVITDALVVQWSRDDAWFPACPAGYEFASGNNDPAQSALTTGTESSCKRMGLCVRKTMMKDAMIDRPLATINLNKTDYPGITSPPIATIDGRRSFDGEGYRQAFASRDIHEGCGDDYYFNVVGYKTEPDSRLLPKPEMDVVRRPDLEPENKRLIRLAETVPGLDYHSLFGFRTEHLQAMIRLPDRNGKEYYMGTYSQDCEDDDCGMVFVGEVPAGQSNGNVIWIDYLKRGHPAQGFNHPGDLHRIGDYVIIAGQNWDECFTATYCLDVGGGGQAVLFYDASDPANPSYIGKMNTCWAGDEIRSNSGEIDTIGLAKIDDTYYLSFNDIRCMSDSFHPYAHWDVVAEAASPAHSPAKFEYGGAIHVGKAAVGGDEIVWQAYTDNFNTLIDVLSTAKTNYDPGGFLGFAKALSPLPDGTYCAITTNVSSDDPLELWVQCN